MTEWTETDDATLLEKWSEGLSCNQIARYLSDRSRNAVIGRLHRLNAPHREKRKEDPEGYRPRRRRGRPTKPPGALAGLTVQPFNGSGHLHRARVAPSVPLRPSLPEPTGERVGIMDLGKQVCKWPYGAGPDYQFCGAHCENEASPYCDYHKSIAYLEPPKRTGKPFLDLQKRSAA